MSSSIKPLKSNAAAAPLAASLPPSAQPNASVKSSSRETATKMHRRSRTGCFTCRLRRKKCDESKPVCRACRHLNVECEYKRPVWWSQPERRKQHKEVIKEIIKQTKQYEKPAAVAAAAASQAMALGTQTPPSLCHSLPTPEAYDSLVHTRGHSAESSHFSPHVVDFGTPHDFFNSTPMMPAPQWTPAHAGMPFPYYSSPFEVDIKTERQTFVNDIPTHKDSTVSTFSAFYPPPSTSSSTMGPHLDSWMPHDFFEAHSDAIPEEPLDLTFFDFANDTAAAATLPSSLATPGRQAVVHVDDCDRPYLDHFLNKVARLVFPILDATQFGSASADVVIPALESNRCYLHCCLSIAALHMKVTQGIDTPEIDGDIMRHRVATITELCDAFANGTEQPQILEATLGLIFFQSSVGSPNDGLPDIPWHKHFEAVQSLLVDLDLNSLQPSSSTSTPPSALSSQQFNMTLTSWIDILGATMLQRCPVFADSYRQKLEGNMSSGLAELMGCEDRVMYLISEIACLENVKLTQGMDDMTLCSHITNLGEQLTHTQSSANELLANVYSPTGAIRPKQLCKNITAIFRCAARIQLCSLVPEFDVTAPSIVNLVHTLTDAMAYIPAGPDGFDTSLVWPLLVAGGVSTPASSFRKMFADRVDRLGAAAAFGAFGRVNELLHDVWHINDARLLVAEKEAGDEEMKMMMMKKKQSVHWRDVMHDKGWDLLLI